MKTIWSPLTLERVQGIARYIAKDKPSAADKWVKELFKIVDRLALHPRSCRIVSEINRGQLKNGLQPVLS
jgi:plasmid stabilization system protein ParE